MNPEEKKFIEAKFGEINFTGLEQLQGCYDTYQIHYAMDALREVIDQFHGLLHSMEQLKVGARELIDGDALYSIEHCTFDECGNLGDFTVEIVENFDICINNIKKIREQLAPLQRLMPTEDGCVYVDDTLDKKEEEDYAWMTDQGVS